MRTYKFNTLRGLINASCGQLTAQNLFEGRAYLSRGRGLCSVELSDNAKRDASAIFATYVVNNATRAQDMANALFEGRGDFSLFQCFYFRKSATGRIYVSNSLSGSAFESVKREYLRKYC